MTNQLHKAPPHGGLRRIAFNGGQSIREELPFQAFSVNVDNWSPYWYKLAPIEVYIPPFQFDVNIALPAIHSFEFICQSPPGIAQPTILGGTGVPGNSSPIIAVFSSFPTNNDAGNSALQASANTSVAYTFFSGVISQSIPTDVTLYDGLYISVTANQNLVVEIIDSDTATGGAVTTRYRRIMYQNTRLFFVIPKVTKYIRLSFVQDPNIGGVLSGSYSIRPFFGPAQFTCEMLPAPNGTLVPKDTRTTTGEQSVNFTTTGLDSAYITITPSGGAGVTINTAYWVKVFVNNLNSIGGTLVYNKAFLNPVNLASLVVPLDGILMRQVEGVTVFVRPSEGGVTLATGTTEVSLFQGTIEALDTSKYVVPQPYTQIAAFNPSLAAPAVVFTVPLGGVVKSLTLTILTASVTAGSSINFWIGTGAAQTIFFASLPATIAGRYEIDAAKGLQLDNGFSTVWANTNSAASPPMTIVLQLQ